MLKIGDRFDPSELFDGIFIVNPVLAYRGLSPGAKLVWGRMRRFGGKRGKIFPSVATVAQDLGLSLKQTRRYIHELVDEKFMESKGDPGHSNDYHFLWHSAYEGCVGEYRLRQPPLPLKGEVENGENNMAPLPFTGVPTPPFKGSTPLPLKGDIRAEVRAECLREESPIVPFSEKPEPQDNPEPDDCRSIAPPPGSAPPPPREAELCLEDGTWQFLFYAYKRHGMIGRIKVKRDAREIERFESLERTEGTAEARLMFLGYLGTRSPWLKENKWPLAAFLKNPAAYATQQMEPDPAFSRTSGHSGMPSRQTTPYAEPLPGPDPDLIQPQPALPSPREILDEWNAALPERRYPSSRPPASAVLRDPEFIAVRGQVFAKVKAVLDKDTAGKFLWLNFQWVCGSKDGDANWIKILGGTLDSLQNGNGAAKPSAADRHRALAEKLIRDSRARQAGKAPTGTGAACPPAPAG